MRIISKPAEPEVSAWKREVTCPKCSSVLEVDANDLRYSEAMSDGPHHSPERVWCECPVCRQYLGELHLGVERLRDNGALRDALVRYAKGRAHA